MDGKGRLRQNTPDLQRRIDDVLFEPAERTVLTVGGELVRGRVAKQGVVAIVVGGAVLEARDVVIRDERPKRRPLMLEWER